MKDQILCQWLEKPVHHFPIIEKICLETNLSFSNYIQTNAIHCKPAQMNHLFCGQVVIIVVICGHTCGYNNANLHLRISTVNHRNMAHFFNVLLKKRIKPHCTAHLKRNNFSRTMPSKLIIECSKTLKELGLTIAFAESATAGRIASEFSLTGVFQPGSTMDVHINPQLLFSCQERVSLLQNRSIGCFRSWYRSISQFSALAFSSQLIRCCNAFLPSKSVLKAIGYFK